MRFILLTLFAFISTSAFAEDYDIRNRQACIDELKSETDKVCQGIDQGVLAGMLKNAGYIAETNSRIQRICSYHCPSDITHKCFALLGRGATILQDVLSGKLNMMETYKDGCAKLNAQIDDAKKDILARGGKAPTKSASTVSNGFASGNFRKPSSAGASKPSAPAPKAKCNPYNAQGQLEVGKCDD